MPMPKSHLPQPRTGSFHRMTGFTGLDRRGGTRVGSLREAEGIDPRAFPELATMLTPRDTGIVSNGTPLSIFCIEGQVFLFSNQAGMVLLTRIRQNGKIDTVALGSVSTHEPRSIVRFNRYTDPLDPVGGKYIRSVIIFPDKLSFDFDAEQLTLSPLEKEGVAIPNITRACVHLSRVFGAAGDRLYASAYNDPTNFDLDTAGDSGAANAWATTAQSNSRAAGDFTAVTVFDGHVLALKKGFTHIVNNTKNPFRVADLLTVGTADMQTLCEAAGQLFFASEQEVYRYDGATLTAIGAELGQKDFRGAVGTSAGGLYYLAVPREKNVFVYDPQNESWGALGHFSDSAVLTMTGEGNVCYLVTADGHLYTTGEADTAEFSCTVAPALFGKIAPRRLSRLALLLSAEEGAELDIFASDTSGQKTPLLHFTAKGGTESLSSRAFTPQDACFSLQLSGHGDIRIHTFELSVLSDGSV